MSVGVCCVCVVNELVHKFTTNSPYILSNRRFSATNFDFCVGDSKAFFRSSEKEIERERKREEGKERERERERNFG